MYAIISARMVSPLDPSKHGNPKNMISLCVCNAIWTSYQGKTPWVDQSCADCPGFLVLGVGDAPPPELHPGASECAPGLAFAFMALRANSWICCPQLPHHPSKNRTHNTCFSSTGGHTPKERASRKNKLWMLCEALFCALLGGHTGTLALKTENFRNIGHSSKTRKWIY